MGAPKLLVSLGNSCLLEHALKVSLSSLADSVIAVTGAYHTKMLPLLNAYSVRWVHNERWADGQAGSVSAAARYCQAKGFDAMLLMVADQPFVTAAHLDALIQAYLSGKAEIFFSQVGTQKGNPCLFDACCYPALTKLAGDTGAKRLFGEDSGYKSQPVVSDSTLLFEDIDTKKDLERLRGMLRDAW